MQSRISRIIDPTVRDFLESRSEASFIILYNKHNNALYRMACSFMNYNEDDAQDVLQESWLVAIRKLDSFRGESTFKTWITAILINKCREKARQMVLYNRESVEFYQTVNQSIEMTADKLDIQSALARLAPGQRKVLILHDAEGFKHEEIAMLLQISIGTSKSQLFDARRIVRHFLTEIK